MRYTKDSIINALNILGIDYNSNQINSKGWMLIRCPLHNDEVMNNAGININNGVISCFACQNKASIYTLLKNKFNYSHKQICEILEQDYLSDFSIKKEKYKPVEVLKNIPFDFESAYFDPKDFIYTASRKYTKRYCKEFKIKQCLSGYKYIDYFITPIVDSYKNINGFEARKLLEEEFLKNYFNIEFSVSLKRMKKKYKEIDKDPFSYPNKSKVLYPKYFGNFLTLFNIDNLNYNQDLYVTEGLASHPSIYINYYKNVTSVMGAKISKEQIEYLNKFKKRIIILSDWDEASKIMVENLYQELKTPENLFISGVKEDDKHPDFLKNLFKKEYLTVDQFLKTF